MNLWQKFLRAEYSAQSGQRFRRLRRIITGVPRQPRATLLLPWGFPITVDPQESIGKSIVALNALDLPVTETIWRLLDNGETAADVGANIGYMTSVMAARLRSGGVVHSFEPVPELAAELEAHAAAWRARTGATLRVRRIAISDTAEMRTFHLPGNFHENRGLGMLTDSRRPREAEAAGGREFAVECARMDALFPAPERIALAKIDVEGGEQAVLAGAEALLGENRIRDLVLEEYERPETAASLATLRRHGYTLFRVVRAPDGPALLAPEAEAPDTFDPPTFLATCAPDRARARFASRGWQSLMTRSSA